MAHIDDPLTQKANLGYIRHSMQAALLEKDREQELARAWRDRRDTAAMHEMIGAYRRLVIASASKFRHYGLPLGDLIQEGNIGLMEAMNRFDPERDVRFSTYASWWIRSCMQDYVLRNWSIVRTGTTAAQKSLFFNLRRLRARIAGEIGEHDLNGEGRQRIAKELGVAIKDVEDMEQRLAANDQSLNVEVGEKGETELQSLIADNGPSPEEVVIGMKDAESRSRWLNESIAALSDREQRIIRERHLSYEPVTLEDLGRNLGVSKERVRQLEQRAMSKLRASMARHVQHHNELFLEG